MPCITRGGTEIIRWDKNKNIYRGLVPLVPAVPANYTIPGRRFFRCATYDLSLRKLVGDHRRISRYSRDSWDKVSTDNSISVPLDNSIAKQMGQMGHNTPLFGRNP